AGPAVTLSCLIFRNGRSCGAGGAVFNDQGMLTVTNSTFANNVVNTGDGQSRTPADSCCKENCPGDMERQSWRGAGWCPSREDCCGVFCRNGGGCDVHGTEANHPDCGRPLAQCRIDWHRPGGQSAKPAGANLASTATSGSAGTTLGDA